MYKDNWLRTTVQKQLARKTSCYTLGDGAQKGGWGGADPKGKWVRGGGGDGILLYRIIYTVPKRESARHDELPTAVCHVTHVFKRWRYVFKHTYDVGYRVTRRVTGNLHSGYDCRTERLGAKIELDTVTA